MESFEIKFIDDYVIIRTVDNLGFPIEIWRFDKNNLSKNERVFIDNIKSMATSMTIARDKNTRA